MKFITGFLFLILSTNLFANNDYLLRSMKCDTSFDGNAYSLSIFELHGQDEMLGLLEGVTSSPALIKDIKFYYNGALEEHYEFKFLGSEYHLIVKLEGLNNRYKKIGHISINNGSYTDMSKVVCSLE